MFFASRTFAGILTCHGAVSMVRAVSVGGGAFFSEIARRGWVSTAMANGTHNNGRGEGERDKPPADEAALSARLNRLNHRLSDLRKVRKNQTDQSGSGAASANASAMARGFRLSSELIAGVVVGAVIGWGIDRLGIASKSLRYHVRVVHLPLIINPTVHRGSYCG